MNIVGGLRETRNESSYILRTMREFCANPGRKVPVFCWSFWRIQEDKFLETPEHRGSFARIQEYIFLTLSGILFLGNIFPGILFRTFIPRNIFPGTFLPITQNSGSTSSYNGTKKVARLHDRAKLPPVDISTFNPEDFFYSVDGGVVGG